MTRFHLSWVVAFVGGVTLVMAAPVSERAWLAGDSHIHSHWSVGYDREQIPPVPVKGRDALYSTPRNAFMARMFGLRWMVTTDHGGPNHSKINLEQAYRELGMSRTLVPEVLQFYGMELNMPGMDHHTLIIPRADDEATVLYGIESRFDANEDWALPPDPRRRSAGLRRSALEYMRSLPRLPLVFANHPSRSAQAIGVYGLDHPSEIRENNDVAPRVYRGMEGAPGHQAGPLVVSGRGPGNGAGVRGGYRNPGAGTMGGFDQMTAIVGGLWDALLGEGRRFWVVATSDSHFHHTEVVRRGSDFWPGEFQKTYVWARATYGDVLDGLRQGRVFAVAGDLISELDVRASVADLQADIGGTLAVERGQTVAVTIRFRDPNAPNENGDNPRVRRVDLIVGEVQGPLSDPTIDRNPTTRVVARVTSERWAQDGEQRTVELSLPNLQRSSYLRVRGTSTRDSEPVMDEPGEDPWDDLWFYSNPIFLEVD